MTVIHCAGILETWLPGHGKMLPLASAYGKKNVNLCTLTPFIPGAVWLMLLLVGGCGSWGNGYSTGATCVRSVFTLWIFPILIGIVTTLIVDIDSPQRGLIRMNQTPLVGLLESMGS
jgi:hypothetical protein